MSGESDDLLVAEQPPPTQAADPERDFEHGEGQGKKAPSSRFEYHAHIDGLRAVAVASVVVYHLNALWLPGGFTGVDVFFVISGYVVAGSLFNHMTDHPRETAGDFLVAFYERRIKRLAPALVLVVVATCLANALLVHPAAHVEDTYEAGVAALCGFANVYFTWQSTLGAPSYFDQMTGEMRVKANPLMHTWSLGVEEQFYLVAPAAILLVRGARLSGVPPLATLVSMCCVSLLGCWFATDLFQVFAFYNMPARLWELAAGVVAADLETFGAPGEWSAVKERLQTASWNEVLATAALDIAAVALLAGSFVLVAPGRMSFPFPGAVLPVAAALCVVVAGKLERSVVSRVLSLPPVVYVGKISYPAYLWHWPLLVLSRQTPIAGLPDVARVPLLVALILALAAATHRWVEGGFRDWRPRERWSVVRLFAPATLAAVCVLLVLRGPLHDKLYFHAPPQAGRMALQSPPAERLLEGPGGGDACACIKVPEHEQHPPGAQTSKAGLPSCLPQPVDVDIPVALKAPYLQRLCDEGSARDPGSCYVDWGTVDGPCLEHGTNSSRPNLFLLGDSHAIAFGPALYRALAASVDVKAQSNAGLSACLLDRIENNVGGLEVKQETCDSLWTFVNSSVRAHDIVAIGNFLGAIPQERASEYIGNLKRLASMIKAKGGEKLVVLGDYQDMQEATPQGCIFSNLIDAMDDGSCWIAKDDSHPGRVLEAEIAKQANSSGYLFFPVRDLFCSGDGCGPHIPGTSTMAYADFGHVSWDGAAYMAPFLCSQFQKAGLPHGLVQHR